MAAFGRIAPGVFLAAEPAFRFKVRQFVPQLALLSSYAPPEPSDEAKELMLLFLDFDGVLRRKQAPLYKLEAALVERLAGLLHEYPEVEVIVTSSWTDAYPLEQIKRLFPPDIASRIVGKTSRASNNFDHARYCEVLVYLSRVAGAGPWVALDDDPLHYPEHAPVVLVDPEHGVDVSCVESLRHHFEKAREQATEG